MYLAPAMTFCYVGEDTKDLSFFYIFIVMFILSLLTLLLI